MKKDFIGSATPQGGRYSISLRKSGCIYKTITVTVPEGENFTIDDVELIALSQYWFILRDQKDEPVNSMICFLHTDAQGWGSMHIQPYQNGLFQREQLQPGAYKVKITAPGYEDFEKEITIPDQGFPRHTPYEIIMKKLDKDDSS